MAVREERDSQYANQVYRAIVLALANGFLNARTRAGLVVKQPVREALVNQIMNLLGLEKRFNCRCDNRQYAVVFAQALANVTGDKATIAQSELSITDIDAKYNQFLTVLEEELALKPAIFKDESVNLQTKTFASLQSLSLAAAQRLLHPTPKKHPQAQVEQQQHQQRTADERTTNQTPLGFKFNREFFNWNPGKIPGGNFPRHPIYDARFYPYQTKWQYFPVVKYVVAGLCALTSAVSFFTVLLCLLKPIEVKISGWSLGDKGIVIGDETDGFGLHLMPLNSILFGVGWFAAIATLIPGTWIAFAAFSNQKLDRNRYAIGRVSLLFAIIMYGSSLYSLLSFLVPMSFNRYLKSLFSDPAGGEVNRLVDYLNQSSFYTAVWILSIFAAVIVFTSIVALVVLLFLDPKIDRQKIMRAHAEYQKAVAARYNGQEYQIDPTLFESVKPRKRKTHTS